MMDLKLKVEVRISKSVRETAELFCNPSHTPKWLKGLRSFELIEGELGMPGARANVTFVNGLTKLKMIETVHFLEIPDRYILGYEADGFDSMSYNLFREHSEGETRFVMEQHIRFKGAMKVAGLFAKGGIKRQMNKDAKAFKSFVEKV